jgi:predicted dehydrogenase
MKASQKPSTATPRRADGANPSPARSMKRRQFLKSSAFMGAAGLLLPRFKLFGADAPSNKLNIAMMGTWGRAEAHFDAVSRENVVALCDINEKHLASAAVRFPNAKHYVDWRQCLEQKDVDAVMVCTLDHTHAFITNWAMNRGKHVYCEKPLANSVEEARVVRANWLKNKDKLATQMGTQRHAFRNFDRVREMVLDGAIGQLQEVSAWGNRQIRKDGYLPAEGTPPDYLHYDLWLGPAPYHPYNPGYFSGGSGANCLQWNMYWDFGSGQVGDMGSHTMDLAWNAIDAGLPISAEGKGDPFNADVTPVKLETHFEFPANDWRSPIVVSWYQGGAMPESPNRAVDLKKIDHGAMFEGSEGFVVADFQSRILIPQKNNTSRNDADMTYYKPRSKETLTPPLGGFQEQWIKAAKGNLRTSCDFGYGTNMTETMLLGLVAYRAGKKISYDGTTGQVTDCTEANGYLRRTYREGWTLNG